MEKLIHFYQEQVLEKSFRLFQDRLANSMYSALRSGYANSENDEIALIERLVDAVNGQSYRNISFHANKIHGTRSKIRYQYRAQKERIEAGDMVIITLATDNHRKLFERITIVQNKKKNKTSWPIDLKQLFFLKNFPSFHGVSGIFSKFTADEVLFFNRSKCLGSYGLFSEPGEMVFLSAPLLSELIGKKKSISPDDIKLPDYLIESYFNLVLRPYSFMEVSQEHEKPLIMFSGPFSNDIPYLRNDIFARDLHDFARSWTLFNIGEPTVIHGDVVDDSLNSFSNYLLKETGIAEKLKLSFKKSDFNFKEYLESDVAVFVSHIDVSDYSK